MELRPLKNDDEYEEMLEWVDDQFDQRHDPNSMEGNKLQVALLIIKAYEDENYQAHLSQ